MVKLGSVAVGVGAVFALLVVAQAEVFFEENFDGEPQFFFNALEYLFGK